MAAKATFYKTISIGARKLVAEELEEKSGKVRLYSPKKKKSLADICIWARFGVEKDYLLLAEILLDQKLITRQKLNEMAKRCAEQARA